MTRYYLIAGLIVGMDVSGRTESQAIPYQVSSCGEVDITIVPDVDALKVSMPELSDDSCLYLATGIDFHNKLLSFDGLRIHSSSVVIDGRAYLFSATSGTGKSTHTGIWRRVFGDERVRVLNDDKTVIRLEDGIWYAYGSPWSGKYGINTNIKAPVGGIAMIERGERNEIEIFSGRDAVVALLKQSTVTDDAILRLKLLELLDKLMAQVPVWKLKCNMDPEAAIVAYEAMSGNKLEGERK